MSDLQQLLCVLNIGIVSTFQYQLEIHAFLGINISEIRNTHAMLKLNTKPQFVQAQRICKSDR